MANAPTTICPGPTNTPTQGLHYRVVVSVDRILDSAIIEQSLENEAISTGTTPGTAVPPFRLISSAAFPRETRMENMVITRIPGTANFARVRSNVVIPMDLVLMDTNNTEFRTHTNYTCAQDVVLFIPVTTTFPYEIASEGTTATTEGSGTRETITINRLCTRIITRVIARSDLLIPAYGFAPINRATAYEDPGCRDFFAQPLFPNGRASTTCIREQ